MQTNGQRRKKQNRSSSKPPKLVISSFTSSNYHAETLECRRLFSGSLSGTQSAAPSAYNLTTLGTADWAHWGRGSNYSNFDHKATGGTQISNVSVAGGGANSGGYADNSRSATWTDGTPATSDASEHGYIWSNGALSSGYSFTAPADTTSRTLTVYAGGVNTTSSLTAHLSDGSAADVVMTAGTTGVYTNAYTITYLAASAGQKLTVTLTKTGNLGGRTDGSADLIGATLTAAAASAAPVVTTQPTAQSVMTGSTATFTAVASGTPTPTVQWQLSTDGGATYSDIAGATSTTLTVTNAALSQSGDRYRAVFTNAAGAATTSAATLTVTSAAAAPTITANPTNQTVVAPSSATFTAAATGTPTPTVQWQQSSDGGATFSNIINNASATTTTLTLASTSIADNAKRYRAVFTSSGASTATTAATLTVNLAPDVSSGPKTQTATVGQDVIFTAGAVANPTPTVQWMLEPAGASSYAPILGATSTTLDIGPATLSENGNKYKAIFTNYLGSATTPPATLTVIPASSSGSLTGSQAAAPSTYNLTTLGTADWAHWGRGSSYSNFDHKATGGSQISNVSVVGSGANSGGYADNSRSATWTDGTPIASDAGEHGYIWSNGALSTGYSFTAPADLNTRTLTVYAGGNNSTSSLTAHLSDGSAADVVMNAGTAGLYTNAYTITYKAASAGQTLKITLLKAGNFGGRTDGSADLVAASLISTAGTTAPSILANPANPTVFVGNNVSFDASASGTPTPTVQWQVSTDGGATFANITGNASATTTTLLLSSVTANQSGSEYRAVFTNSAGSATTRPATLTVTIPTSAPVVSVNPTNQNVAFGAAATFTAGASGNPTPTVQWQVSTDGGATYANITGNASATTATLTLPGFSFNFNDTGNRYRAVFTNSVGSATTSAATLTVTPQASAPIITVNPTDQYTASGNGATFTAAANGSPMPTVQWQVSSNGGTTFANITDNASATTTTLTIPTVNPNYNVNSYRAVFTNSAGSVATTAASLTAYVAPVVTSNPVSQIVPAGGTATFSVAGTGTPAPIIQWEVSTDGGATFSLINDNASATTATLTLAGVTTAQNGTQYRALLMNPYGQVASTAATLTVTSAAGSLVASQAAAPSTYNLTALGTTDWAHWGRGSNASNFDHKASGGSKISNVSVVGSGANSGGYADNSRSATWTDGTPAASDTNEHGYIWSNGALNSGYSFTATADTTTRTLTVYAGGNNTTSSIRASLSDGSAADVIMTAGAAGIYSNVYTITYKAASAGQKLTITLLKTGNLGGQTNGSADLVTATLR